MRDVKKIWLPYFLCDSVFDRLQRSGVEVEFYSVNDLLLPKFEKECYIKLVKVENNKKIYQITNLGKKKLRKEKERMLKQISLLDQIGG